MEAHGGPTAIDTQSPQQRPRLTRHRPVPAAGDVLVSEPTARADVYVISVVPAQMVLVMPRYAEAIAKVREMARERAVDGWYTCDQTHYAQIARHRVQGHAGCMMARG